MKRFNTTLFAVIVGVLMTALLMASIAVAANNSAEVSKKKKKKPVLTSKQKKSINKMIDSKIKQINIPVGPTAYTTKNDAQVNIPSDLDVSTPVLSKAVPAGKYVVNAHVNGFYLTNDSADEANLICRLKVNGTTVQQGQAGNDAGIFLFLATAASLNMSFNVAVDATAASTLSIDCSGGYDSPGAYQGEYVSAGQASLTAVTVSSIG